MPFARNGTVKLHWESFGEGPAVLLVAGQGMTAAGWWATIPALARSFRVIAFDNRDTGRSSRLPWPYSVAQLAHDAVAVLDAAGEERAHMYGISLGSLVAQEVALQHPDRVQALVLGASSAGGFAAYKPPPSSFAQTFLVRVGAMGPDEAAWAAVPYTYAEKTRRLHPERIVADITHRVSSPPEPLAYLHQAAAVAAHDAYERLNQMAAPTLVVHGDEPRADRDIARFLLHHSAVRPTRDVADRAGPERSHDRGWPARGACVGTGPTSARGRIH